MSELWSYLDCLRYRAFFSGPEPGPPGSVQLMAESGPGPHWTGSIGVGPGVGQV